MSDPFYWRPILCVRNVDESIAYYCEKLGFESSWSFPPEGKRIIGQVGRDGLDLILDCGSVIPRAAMPSVISASVPDLRALHAELETRGASLASSPAPVPWQQGVEQFVAHDLDGNVLVFWCDVP